MTGGGGAIRALTVHDARGKECRQGGEVDERRKAHERFDAGHAAESGGGDARLKTDGIAATAEEARRLTGGAGAGAPFASSGE